MAAFGQDLDLNLSISQPSDNALRAEADVVSYLLFSNSVSRSVK